MRPWTASALTLALLLGIVPALGGSPPAAADEHDTGVAAYLLLGQFEGGPYLVPVEREVGDTDAVAHAAVTALLEGPTTDEEASLPAISTAIPDGVTLNDVTVTDGLATVDLSDDFDDGGGSFSMLARLSQLVFTLTQFTTVDGIALELDGDPVTVFSSEGIDISPPLTRASLEDAGVLPPVLVETPRYGGAFAARVVGSSDVPSFDVQILDGDGRLYGSATVSTPSVNGRRDFDVTVPYISLTEQFGIVLVEDPSDRDGSVREYPLTLAKTPVPFGRGFAEPCPEGEVPDSGFLDVDPAATHADAIECIAALGITVGRDATSYEPERLVLRGQAAEMITRILTLMGEELPDDPPMAFEDVEGTTHELAINQLAALGLVEGRLPGSFAPYEGFNRGQMAAVSMRVFEYLAGFAPEPDQHYFSDVAGETHEDAIDAAALTGVTEGIDGDRYASSVAVRRDQMATFMARLVDLLMVEGDAQLVE
jgi:germination protein M